jgi:hypothetical protein
MRNTDAITKEDTVDKEMQISKLDAARRQLETAIRLYFHTGDPVSIHTLTAAAYQIIRNINQARGGEKRLQKDQILELAKPEFRAELIRKMNAAENFFKHADKDPNVLLEFNPAQTDIMIQDALECFFHLTGEQTPLMSTYKAWFMATRADLFNLSPEQKQELLLSEKMGKLDFFNKFLPLAMKI